VNNDDERDYAEEAANRAEMEIDDSAEMTVSVISFSDRADYNGHEFGYVPEQDLFRCENCREWQVSVRDAKTGLYDPCTGGGLRAPSRTKGDIR